MSLKNEIAEVLEKIADILDFKGENRFKVAAYKNGANTIRRINGDIESKISDGSIANIKGIGKGLLSVINDFYSHRESTELKKLQESIPLGIGDLFSIRGLGSKKIKLLFDSLNISDLESLEHACKNNELINISGFSQKTQENILKEIKRIKSTSAMMLLPFALERAQQLINDIKDIEVVEKIEFTGELRRQNEVINKIELILLTNNYDELLNSLAKLLVFYELDKFTSYHLLNIVSSDNKIIKIYVTEDENRYNHTLFRTTGSEEFLKELKISEDAKNENDCFRQNGLPYVAPPMREKQYFDAPEKLRTQSNISLSDFKGLLHFHTDWSDGQNTLAEMVSEAENLGFEYAAVCDHSKSAFYANGLSKEQILKQKVEIDLLNSSQDITIFHGIESDILNNGSLDYDNDFMHTFDFVTASIHSNFNMSETEMTARTIKAIESPFTDLFAHPTGRLLLRRKGYSLNIKKILDACAANDVAIEINASPFRLDLDWRNIYYAREIGCKFAINPDAHSTAGISNIKYGIMVAQKAGLQKSELINHYTEKEFISFINRKVNRK